MKGETMEEEIWKPVKGYEGLYEVSSHGNVRSLSKCYKCSKGGIHRIPGRMLKLNKNSRGYFIVRLYNNTHGKTYRVNRLVAIAFLPNPNGYKVVNHKDENKTNNTVENLEWCDHKYNVNFGTGVQRMKENHINHQSLSKRVAQFSLDGILIKVYPSAHEAERALNKKFAQVDICLCCRGGRNSAYGYKWQYI